MNCYSIDNPRALIIPLEHTPTEDLFHKNFSTVISNCDNLIVYWEAINRYEDRGLKESGLEDQKLLALFEIVLFIIVTKDHRLHEAVYKGTGVKDNKFKGVTILQRASNVAKGTQAVINLREYFNHIHSSNSLELEEALKDFDIDLLIRERNNMLILKQFEDKLYKIYNLLLTILLREYPSMDFGEIVHRLNNINWQNKYFDNEYNAKYIKDYIKYIRDVSNANYIYNHSIELRKSNIICCVGSAHTSDLKKELTKKGIIVNEVDILDHIHEDMNDSQIKSIIDKYLKKYFT